MGMIVFNRDSDRQSEFENILYKANESLNSAAQKDVKTYLSLNGTNLEKVVVDALKECCTGTSFRKEDIQILSGQNFPDILASYCSDPRYYGVEVKTTKENKWSSTGSSIVESSRAENIDQIYLLFGKLANPHAEFKTRKYEECLYDIAVTHSPRYLINMDIDANESIFAKMGTNYEEFRTSSDNIERARAYYRQQAHIKEQETGKKELPWWLRGDSLITEDVSAKKIIDITLYSKLSESMKRDLKSKAFILFFEDILSNKSDKYESSVLWFCEKYSVLVHNARDLYTAGGQGYIEYNGICYGPYPKVIISLVEYRHHIHDILNDPTTDFLDDIYKYWGSYSKKELYLQWVNKISEYMESHNSYSNIPISKFLKDI